MVKKKPYGYIVSSSRLKHGKFCETLKEAKKEMSRQMSKGSKESGIIEVWDKKIAMKYIKKRNRI